MDSYEEYLEKQKTRAASKWGRKHLANAVFKMKLREAWERVSPFIPPPERVICMGVRDGTEVVEFKEFYPEAKVCGVELSENVKTFRTHVDVKIMQYDFNDLPVTWEDKFDLVFSNSLDHAYKVEETLEEWHRVTKPNGHLFLELSTAPETNIEYSFKRSQVKKLFPADKFEVLDVFNSPERKAFTVLVRAVK